MRVGDLEDAVSVLANAMRLVAHNAVAKGASFGFRGDTAVMRSIQCGAEITASPHGLSMTVDPLPDVRSEFEAARIVFPRRDFDGSPLMGDAHPDGTGVFGTFARLFDPIQQGGRGSGFVHAGETHVVLYASPAQEDVEELSELERLIRGTDAMSGGETWMLVRHPAFGREAGADPVDAGGVPFAMPDPVPGSAMAAQVERIRMIRRWAARLPEAVKGTVIGERTYRLSPLSYTYADADDPAAARRGAVSAYARLHAFLDGSL